MSTLYDYDHNTGNLFQMYGGNWQAQPFKPSTPYIITSVNLMLNRSGSPGTITVGIQADNGGKPSGTDLCSGTLDGNSISTSATQYSISMGAGATLAAGSLYWIVDRATSGNSSNYVFWTAGYGSGYPAGSLSSSQNSGATWSSNPGYDFWFETYGNPAIAAPTVSTQMATKLGTNTATGNGNITATGGENPGTRGICYSSVHNPPTTADSVAQENGSFGVGVFSEGLTELTMGTTYYIRAFATNSGGSGYGGVVTIKTGVPMHVVELIARGII